MKLKTAFYAVTLMSVYHSQQLKAIKYLKPPLRL